jgi:hypothetical protein
MPYTRQEEDENMSTDEQPMTTENIPQNIPAEALQETLEFERARWQEERGTLLDDLNQLMDANGALDTFVNDLVINVAVAIKGVADGEVSADETLAHLWLDLLNHMPTPSKMALQQHLDSDHEFQAEQAFRLDALSAHLEQMGINPEDVVDAKQEADRQFLRTIIGGMAAGLQPTDEDPDA